MTWVGRDSALLAWIGIAVLIISYATAYDLWAWKTGHKMMTTQFRDWLAHPVSGPVVMGLWGGVFIALSFHFLVRAWKP